MQHSRTASFTEMMSAVNAGDAGRYAALYARDAVITIHGLGVLEGRQAIERHEVDLLRQFPGTRLAFYSIWHVGGPAVVHYAVNGSTPDGRAMGHEGLLFYQFDASGLIQSEHRYMDALTPMAQLGQPGARPVRPAPALPSQASSCVGGGTPLEHANIARVRSSLAALESRNEAAFLSGLAEDAIVDELILARPFRGKENVAVWFKAWTGAFADARCEITSIFAAGEHVLAETVVSGTLESDFGPLQRSNGEFSVHRAITARVRDGALDQLSCFMNGKEFHPSSRT